MRGEALLAAVSTEAADSLRSSPARADVAAPAADAAADEAGPSKGDGIEPEATLLPLRRGEPAWPLRADTLPGPPPSGEGSPTGERPW